MEYGTTMTRKLGALALAGALAVTAAACDDDGTALEPETALLSVAPAGGETDVALDASVMVRFDHAMHDHAMDYAAVHEGDVAGPMVGGTWTMEEQGTVMRFTPDQPWKAGTDYTIHLGGGMQDAGGHMVDLGGHGTMMGGQWATGTMMTGGMGGGMGGMTGGQHEHMGEGWQHPVNGSYGMVFTFTTAG